MSAPQPLETQEIESQIADLDDWSYTDGKLSAAYEFGSFKEAISFIVRIGFEAEAANHHPELTNVYNKVDLKLSTHDADDKVTQKDVVLATAIASIAWV